MMLNNESIKRYVFPLLLALFFFIVSVASIVNKTNTTDEGSHMVRGVMLLRTGDYRLNQHHPVLFNVLNAIPTAFNPNLKTESLDSENWKQAKKDDMAAKLIEINGGVVEFSKKFLFPSRVSMALFSALFILAFYFLIKKEYGYGVAAVSSALLTLSPTFLAHGALVTTDAPAMFTIFLATWSLYRYLKEGTNRNLWIFILLSLLALLSKYTAIFAAAVWLAALLFHIWHTNRKKLSLAQFSPLLKIILAWFIMLWAAYGFQFKTIHEVEYENISAHEATLDHISHLDDSLPFEISSHFERAYYDTKLPFPQYIKGFYDNVFKHNFYGHGSFLLGEFSSKGWWYYFPVAFLTKENLVFVLLTLYLLISSTLSAIKKVRERSLGYKPEYILILVPAFLFILNLQSSINLGIRHLLPVFPFLALYIALKITPILRDSQSIRKSFIVAMGIMVISILSQFPNYIEYFNEASGGPQNGYKILRDSNFDWDQNNGIALEYIRKTPNSSSRFEDLPNGGLLVVRIESLLDKPGSRDEKMEQLYQDYISGKNLPIEKIAPTHWVFLITK